MSAAYFWSASTSTNEYTGSCELSVSSSASAKPSRPSKYRMPGLLWARRYSEERAATVCARLLFWRARSSSRDLRKSWSFSGGSAVKVVLLPVFSGVTRPSASRFPTIW